MWGDRSVSVVLMTYAERDSIRGVIEGFFETGVVDEVLVVNNNAQEGTVEEVEQTKARMVFEPLQGYGHACRRGLREAEGDLIVLAEPDGTFLPKDISKLLAFVDECDAVFGTRTTRELIWHGANMDWFLRWGNWAVAKVIEALFNTTHLSDVGCTYRVFTRELADMIAERMEVGGNHAGPEMMLLTVTSGARFVEIPVNYLPRVGTSSATGSLRTAIGIGLRMIVLILQFRRRTPGSMPRPARLGSDPALGDGRE
jgi:glycosyltransferase involved in cell wall biosynthesis